MIFLNQDVTLRIYGEFEFAAQIVCCLFDTLFGLVRRCSVLEKRTDQIANLHATIFHVEARDLEIVGWSKEACGEATEVIETPWAERLPDHCESLEVGTPDKSVVQTTSEATDNDE